MLDGLAQISKLVPAVEELGMPAIALTDHGSMAATYDLYKATKDTGVKPIYGIEAYVSPAVPRTVKEPVRWNEGGEDDVSGAGAYTHMTLLAESNQGLKNLFQISSEAYLTGFYRKPRTDEELFQTFGKGIIATTGCPSGEVQTWLRIGNYDKAKESAAKFADIFGKENYFVELMDHGLNIERRVIKDLIKIAKELGLQTVATNDLHYVHQSDSHAHEALLCIGSGSKLADPTRFKFDAQDFYLKTPAEMRHIWDDVDGAELACDNTLLIAERATATFEHGEDLMPKFPVPEGETEASWLRKEVEKGFERRYGKDIPKEYRERAEYELGIIEKMKFPGYFLVVADYINWAKEQGIRVGPARGCLSGDSNVITPDGMVNIKEIQVGSKVFNQNGEIVEIPAVFKYECDEELLEIKAFYGAQGNKMTADHKVLVSKANNTTRLIAAPLWMEAREVEVGDYVVMPKNLNKAPEPLNDNKLFTIEDETYVYYQVSEINRVPSEGYVYDFTVPGTNSYVTDSYVVHNSGGGSFVCYLINITDIDPMQHGLLFERFLNPERVSMPDLDIDFDDRRRGEVIEYVKQKYGEDKVANIATFSTIKAKAAFKDSLRVLGAPYMLGDKLSKAYPPPIVGRDLALADAYDPSNERYDEASEFRALVEADPEAQQAVELGLKLEGVKRGFGMHAAGVIMSARPIVETVPLMKRDTNSPTMTQFEYPTCEYLGLIKMDFLGLSNLGTIDECLRLIRQNRNQEVDLDKIGRDLNDEKTFHLLAEGNTIGVFQLDSPPMRALLKLMAPDQFDDISAVLALYRPGPMAMNAHNDYADRKNGRKPVIPIHNELTEPLSSILDETFGIICYQEQVMAIAQKVAGYSLGQADLLRRAMGKKSKEVLDKEYIPFSTGMRENGYSDEAIQTLWEILLPFSDYAFNKSHSAGYGLISYWTAYLKANFPAEYMAALLTTNADNKDKLALYLGECRRMGVKVLPPDVNESELNYTAVGDNIRVGLIGIKGVGEAGVNLWLQERRENGAARSFADFLERADTSISAKGKVEALIVAGAFDCFGIPRSALHYVHEAACEKVRKLKKAKPKNDSVVSLFDAFDDDELKGLGLEIEFPEIDEWEKKEKLARERAVLGLYVSDHPLSGFADGLELLSSHSIAYLRDAENPPTEQVKIAGLVSSVERKLTKKASEPWAIVTVEDLDSGMPVMVFPKTYAEVSDLLVPDAILIFSGRVEKREDGSTTFAVRDVIAPDMAAAQRKAERAKAKALESGSVDDEGKPVIDKSKHASVVEPGRQDDGNISPVIVHVDEKQLTPVLTEKFKELMLDFVGSRPVHLSMSREDGTVVLLALGDQYKVVGSGQFAAEIRALFGPDAV